MNFIAYLFFLCTTNDAHDVDDICACGKLKNMMMMIMTLFPYSLVVDKKGEFWDLLLLLIYSSSLTRLHNLG